MSPKSQNVSGASGVDSGTSTPSAAKDTPAMTASSSRRQSPASATNENIPSSTAATTVPPKLSDPPPSPPNVPDESAPRASSSSAPPQTQEKPAMNGSTTQQAASKETGSGTASPYGTRSRNRTGASRPNYAEDKDLDVEMFEPDRQGSKKAGSANASQGAAAAPRPSNGGSSSRKPLPTESNTGTHHAGGGPASATKEQKTTGSSTATSNSTPAPGATTGAPNTPTPSTTQPSRKRKATAAASQASTPSASHVQQASSNGPTTAVQKRPAVVSHNGNGIGYSETNLLTFENCAGRPKDGKMIADDGTVLEVNDHVYLVCEPPGEPYYLARIMEFLHQRNDVNLPVDALRVNWYYRPKDIGRKVQDTRLVFATMHSDISPLTSLRGKCQIKHKAEIPNLTEYKRQPDCFWYEKLYDRYIQKNYEVIPTKQIVNVPERVKKVLDERWKFILVEQGRGKELTSAVKLCKRCTGYCASNDSVDCAVCQNTYHMNCVRPPLLKKPSRGFAWSCAACSRAQERKLEARNTPNHHDSGVDAEEEEFIDDDDDDIPDTCRTSPAEDDHHEPATAEQIYHASLWPYRYLGIHCKVEDALDYDDRIFPRASTRLGPRHQANVVPWYGRPVEYVKPLEVKKSGKKNDRISKEMQAAIEANKLEKERRPKWIQDEPPGYVERGGDYEEGDPNATSTLLWKPAEDAGASITGEEIDSYMTKAKAMAVPLGLPERSSNLQDIARDLLFKNKYDPEKALAELPTVEKAAFKEPELTPAELKKFEEGVGKFGSELHLVWKHVKTVSKTIKTSTIVRFYYTWKKTDKGKQIWGNYSHRKGKKDAKKAEEAANKLADDVADHGDDSAFDAGKAAERKKGFICKFCSTKNSRQWRRAPNVAHALVTENGNKNSNKAKNGEYIQALCRRCAELWRRYAIQWEDIDEVAKKVAQTGGKGWRKKVDEELYKELVAADEMMSNTRYLTPPPAVTPNASAAASVNGTNEPARKKLKITVDKTDKDSDKASDVGSTTSAVQAKKKEKAPVEKPAPPPEPVMPKPKVLPCAVCFQMEPRGDQHVSCKECRMTVHRNCYGIVDNRAPKKWTCDMCLNDKSPQVSINYKCVLCPVDYIEHDFVEPPKISHKKKTEKEKERERAEKEAAHKAAEFYRQKQIDMNRPTNPREPLKRTADNNWVHVTCAVFTPEVKFGLAKALSPAEGIPSIPRARFTETCKACKKTGGACVSCAQCHASVHVECAHHAGYVLGFTITPVKASRRDQHNIVTMSGETGVMAAEVWCKEHWAGVMKQPAHPMHEQVDDTGLNALQLYVQNCKQADLTLTGCARKANQISLAARTAPPPVQQTAPPHRLASLATIVNGENSGPNSPPAVQPGGKICLTCGVDTSPKWHAIDQEQERGLTNGYYGNLGAEAQKFVEQRSFQCHKCKKINRQPNPHPPRDPSAEAEPLRQAAAALGAAPSMATPPAHAELGPANRAPYVWSPPQPAPASMMPLPPQSQLQAPPMATFVPPVQQAPPPIPPPQLPPTMASQPPPPMQQYPYPLNGPPQHPTHSSHLFGDWQRNQPQHLPHHHQINGGPPPLGPPPALAPPNHLRPPPMSSLTHPPPPPPQHDPYMRQPHPPPPPPPSYLNGAPPSSPRGQHPHPPPPAGPPPIPNGYHPAHGHAMGYPPPPPPPLPHSPEFSNGHPPQQQRMSMLRDQRPPPQQGGGMYPPPPNQGGHGSPPLMPHDLNRDREREAAQRERESRPSGASASPSLRNLLS
ncbi:hypothetical protein GE09DRAFT_432976 [Coniochaeta sp. 2T2.1]|nr:hypothetical protein GE09DRAFT_432976 [Coniochaeta sp. 2T2.1]